MFLKKISLLLFIIACGNLVSAQKYISKEMPVVSKEWHENKFSSTKSFAENISEANEFTIFSKMVLEAPLEDAIKKHEMVTIFAVSDVAFSKFKKKQKDSILGNKALVTSLVQYYTVPGRIDKHGLETEAKKHNGKFFLATLNGEKLQIMEKEGKLYLIDSQGGRSQIIETDFYHKNGFFHIVDGLVFPSSPK